MLSCPPRPLYSLGLKSPHLGSCVSRVVEQERPRSYFPKLSLQRFLNRKMGQEGEGRGSTEPRADLLNSRCCRAHSPAPEVSGVTALPLS